MFGTMEWLRLPLFITILFAMLVAVPFEGAGSRGRALAAVFEAIRHAFVEPMTMPGAVLCVFANSAFFSLVLGRGGQRIAEQGGKPQARFLSDGKRSEPRARQPN